MMRTARAQIEAIRGYGSSGSPFADAGNRVHGLDRKVDPTRGANAARSSRGSVAWLIVWPLAARAQQTGIECRKLESCYRRPQASRNGRAGSGALTAALSGRRGWIEGQTVTFMVRYAEAATEAARTRCRARYAVKGRCRSRAGHRPLWRRCGKPTSTIPIVMAQSGDAVGTGHVAILARPGGNVTGMTLVATRNGCEKAAAGQGLFERLGSGRRALWRQLSGPIACRSAPPNRRPPRLGLV